ncbi:hypothetical protein [Bradyrhizobium liaoningense]|uniref:hypothetical protein n=1 Tax=Bradyrhizobium liaoningense TaxID=43992 RepID=UPI001BAE31DC|nr:hypothetical protein [Bradyrhizobium liaoningense]MBR0712696.1 hypothetical protein [Bradyrhizobium liaoningense]
MPTYTLNFPVRVSLTKSFSRFIAAAMSASVTTGAAAGFSCTSGTGGQSATRVSLTVSTTVSTRDKSAGSVSVCVVPSTVVIE